MFKLTSQKQSFGFAIVLRVEIQPITMRFICGPEKSPSSFCHPEPKASVTKCQRRTFRVTQMVRLYVCVSLSVLGNTLMKTLKWEQAGGTTRLIADFVLGFFYDVEELLRSAQSIFNARVRG